MLKTISLALAGVVAAGTAAIAGTVEYVAPPMVEVMEPSGSMGSSGAWIIPVLAIVLIAVAVSASDD